MNNYKIISVESKKGGVGKSTIALNVAKIYRSYSNVLIIDTDFMGTSLEYVKDSPYWKRSVNVLNENLITIFQKEYLLGNGLKKFKFEENSINILPSNAFNDDVNAFDPRIMFDELHTYWIISMIKEISNNFVSNFKNNKENVIILDNSPGEFSLIKSINDWLTTLGFKNAKFITVSSFDTQDLKASEKSLQEIENQFKYKLKAAEYYNNQTKSNDLWKEDDDKVKDKIKDFFIKLVVDSYNNQSENNCLTDYYFYKNSNNLMRPPRESYQALVLNKVPKIYNDIEKSGYDFRDDEMKKIDNLSNKFLCKVGFDESIMYQYGANLVLNNQIFFNKNKILSKIENELNEIKYFVEKNHNSIEKETIDYKGISFKKLKHFLTVSKLNLYTKFFSDKYLPSFYINRIARKTRLSLKSKRNFKEYIFEKIKENSIKEFFPIELGSILPITNYLFEFFKLMNFNEEHLDEFMHSLRRISYKYRVSNEIYIRGIKNDFLHFFHYDIEDDILELFLEGFYATIYFNKKIDILQQIIISLLNSVDVISTSAIETIKIKLDKAFLFTKENYENFFQFTYNERNNYDKVYFEIKNIIYDELYMDEMQKKLRVVVENFKKDK